MPPGLSQAGMLLVVTPAALGGVAVAAKAAAALFALEAGSFRVGVFWATRAAAPDAESAMVDVTGAGTALVFDATCIGGAEAELGTAAFCAETTPKAARPRVSNAPTTITTKRIVSLRHQRIDSRKVKAQSASESTATAR